MRETLSELKEIAEILTPPALVIVALAVVLLLIQPAQSQTQLVEFLGGTSPSHSKYIQIGVTSHINDTPFTVGAALGLINYRNALVFDAYRPHGQLEVGYRVTSGSIYGHIRQGVAFKAPENIKSSETLYTFPTTVSAGIQDDEGSYIGAFFTHYSNGGTGRGNVEFNAFGIAIGKSF